MSHPSEADEWLEELVYSWTEVYKKSMTTLMLLRVINELGPIAAEALGRELEQRTGWSLTERGLYRTLRRLASAGLLLTAEEPAARTGVMRKLFTLSETGGAYLRRLNEAVLDISPGS